LEAPVKLDHLASSFCALHCNIEAFYDSYQDTPQLGGEDHQLKHQQKVDPELGLAVVYSSKLAEKS